MYSKVEGQTNAYTMTLKDSSRNNFQVVSSRKVGGKLVVEYSGAKDGANGACKFCK